MMARLRCWGTRNLLDLFVDGRLAHDQEHCVDAHLEACADCRAEAEALKPLPLLASAPPAVPPGLAASILKRLAQEEEAPTIPLWHLTPAQAAGLAVAALLVISHAMPGPSTRATPRPQAEAPR